MENNTRRGTPWVTPAITTTVALFFISVIVTGASTELQAVKTDIRKLREDVAEMRADPESKPKTKVALDNFHETLRDMKENRDKVWEKIGRIEDRINSLHLYMMQFSPPTRGLPHRRGDSFTFPEGPTISRPLRFGERSSPLRP
jgi:hypothetical protein